jgi:cell division protein FtsZ
VLNCPLLENADISDAKNLLFFVTYGPNKKITMGELELLSERFEEMQSESVHVIWGHGLDESLGNSIKLSLVVTNFDSTHREDEQNVVINTTEETIVNTIEETPETSVIDSAIEEHLQEQSVAQEQVVLEPETPSAPTFSTDTVERSSESSNLFTFPSHNEPFANLNYDDDDTFNRMVNQPTITRDETVFSTQNKTQVAVEEPNNAYYELKDDVYDVFHGFAD